MTLSVNVGAGDLTERAELQSKSQSRTTAGGVSVIWETERRVWCKITGLSPALRFEAGAREPQITHEIIARLEKGDITPKKRLLVNGTRTFMISGIVDNVDEADDLVRFGATEGVAT